MSQGIPAGRGWRFLYCVALLTLIPSMLFGGAGWIGLTTGGGLLALAGPVGLLVIAVLILVRIGMVIRSPAALDFPSGGFPRAVCGLGAWAMVIGALAGVGLFFAAPIGLLLFGRTEAGVGIYITGIFLYLGSNLGWIGVLIFEAGRLFDRMVPDGEAGVRFAKWVRIARYTVLALAVAGAAYLHVIARSERQAFAALCAKLPQPTVKERAGEVFDSVLIDSVALRPLHRAIFALGTANIEQLAFVEECFGPGSCRKIINSRTGHYARNDMRQTKEPESRILLGVQPLVVRSSGAGTTTHEVEYRMSERRSGKTLASAPELVFDWGLLSPFRRLVHGDATGPVEACGYAFPQPHPFRSNAIGDHVSTGYAGAEKALILSVLPAK